MPRYLFLVFALLTSLAYTWPSLAQVAADSEQTNLVTDIAAATLSERQVTQLQSYLQKHQQPAVEFVVDLFRSSDLVLLGEQHQVAENCRFVSSLIKPMYESGVRTLFWEFARSEFNADIERLVTSSTFDDKLAYRIMRNGAWPTWGYQEYVDILRAAWRLNSSLPAGSPPFRVIGIDSDWSQYELWFGKQDRMAQFKTVIAREKHMIRITKSQSLAKNEKALVHIGYAHTLTNSGERLGTVLSKEIRQSNCPGNASPELVAA